MKSVRFGGSQLYRPGVYTVVDTSQLLNILINDQGVVGVVGEATGGQPGVLHVFDSPSAMISELIGGNSAEMAQPLFFPSKDKTIRGASQVVFVKSNQSTRATMNLVDGAATVQAQIQSRVWGAPANFTWAQLAAGTQNGRVFTAGRDSAPLAGQSQALSEIGRTDGSPNLDAWLKVWWDKSKTTSTHLSCTITYNPNANSLVSTMAGGVDGNTGKLNFTDGNDGLLSSHTIETLAAVINTKLGWSCTILRPLRKTVNARQGDTATAIDVFNENGGAVYWDSMAGVYDLVDEINTNSVFWAATKTAVPPVTTQLPANFAKAYGQGGTLGASSAQNIQDAMKLLLKADVRCEASGYEADVGGTTIGTINGYWVTHVQTANRVGARTERTAYVADGSHTTRATLEAALQALNEPDVLMWAQDIKRENQDGVQTVMGAHVGAAACAGMRAGSAVGTPLTAKLLRANDVTQTGWDPTADADVKALVLAGLTFATPVPGQGYKILKELTTYSAADNDALCFGEVRDEIRFLKRVLRDNIEPLFIGTKGYGTPSLDAVKERASAVLDIMSDTGNPDFILVEGTDENGDRVAPWRNLTASITGNVISLRVEVTFAEGIDYVLNTVVATPLAATV